MTRRGRLALWAVGGALVLLFGGRWIALRYTEHAWYAEQGYGALYWRLLLRGLVWQTGLFLLATGWYAAHALAVVRSIGAVHLPRRVGNLEINEAVPRIWLRWLAVGIALTLGLATAYSFSDLDHFAALYRGAVKLGVDDPVLGKDAAFYLARLPLLEVLQLAALLTAILGLLLAAGLYLLTGSLSVADRRLRITPHARTHIVICLALLAAVLAWGFQLRGYEIVGGGGDLAGALSETDRAIRLPASNALALIALVVAAGTVFSLRTQRSPLLVYLWATLLVSALLGRLVVPVFADAWGTPPSGPGAFAGWSQLGFEVQHTPRVGAGRELEPPEGNFAPVDAAVAGYAPWSSEPGLLAAALGGAVPDSAGVRSWHVTVSAWPMAGSAPQLVALGVAQTDPLRLAEASPRPRWSATHREALAWGGPVVAVDAAPRAGPLRFIGNVRDADTGSRAPRPLAGLTAPIRFVPQVADLAVVGPDEAVAGRSPPGLLLGGFVRRLLFAWALQAPPLLGSRTSAADRVLFWRDVPTRLARLYPFALFDGPRAVPVGTGLVWLSDGYLASPRYPLATHVRWRDEAVNYLAAPYVAVVDAEFGVTRLYLRPGAPPFAASVARAEGIEPLPPDSLPAAVRAQLGYPAALLGAQAAAIARAGADSAGNPESWTLAAGDTAHPGDAAYFRPALAVLDLGGGPRAWQLVPLADETGNRLTAIVAGSADAGGMPELRVYVMLRDGFPTPRAVARRLEAGTTIKAAVTRSDSARHGEVVALPAASTVAYAGAVYAAEAPGRPMMLRAVGVAAGSRVGFGLTSDEAVAAAARGDAGTEGMTTGAALESARAAFMALDSALRNADWSQVGRAYESLRRALSLEPAAQP